LGGVLVLVLGRFGEHVGFVLEKIKVDWGRKPGVVEKKSMGGENELPASREAKSCFKFRIFPFGS